MAISITANAQIGPGTYGSVNNLTMSTATGLAVAWSTTSTTVGKVDILSLDGGTATGGINESQHLVEAGNEGDILDILMTATGNQNVALQGNGTATGMFVYQSAGDRTPLKVIDGTWTLFGGGIVGATIGSASQ